MNVVINESEILTETQIEFIKHMASNACENYRRDGHVVPAIIMHSSASDKTYIVSATFGNEREKDLLSYSIKSLSKEHSCDSLIFICESYTLRQEDAKDFMENRHKYPSVSSHPNRQDCIMISYESKNGTWFSTVMVDDKKKVIIGDTIEFMKGDKMAGRFSNLLA